MQLMTPIVASIKGDVERKWQGISETRCSHPEWQTVKSYSWQKLALL